jgi:Mn-dependent DtxR family transcriptional regulator
MQVRASAEDYLETILLLSKKQGYIRAIDIAGEMEFSKPSVSVAMKKLREEDLVLVDDDGFIRLTDKGNDIASNVYKRHSTLYDFLVRLGVDEKTAASDACKLEHIISEQTFKAISSNLDKTEAKNKKH